MRREWRLRSPADFGRVRRQGRSRALPSLVIVAARASDPSATTRIGITVGKRVGGAVVRNRVKRRIREALRLRYAQIEPGWDLVFIARPYAAGASYEVLAEAVADLLRRSGLERPEVACEGSHSS